MSSEIGLRLKEERARLGYSQSDFAEKGGVGRTSQVKYEAGERVPDGNYLKKVSELGVDILYVVTGKGVGEQNDPGWPEDRHKQAIHVTVIVMTALEELALISEGAGRLEIEKSFNSEQQSALFNMAYKYKMTTVDEMKNFICQAYLLVTGKTVEENITK